MNVKQRKPNKISLERIIRTELLHKLDYLTSTVPDRLVEFLIDNCKLLNVSKYQHLEESRDFDDGKLFYLHKGIARSNYYDLKIDKLVVNRIWTNHDVILLLKV